MFTAKLNIYLNETDPTIVRNHYHKNFWNIKKIFLTFYDIQSKFHLL